MAFKVDLGLSFMFRLLDQKTRLSKLLYKTIINGGIIMINSIVQAINNREEISFTYSGLPRVVQPCAVGISTAGNEVLRCFQTQGAHITPDHEWNMCIVSKISNLQFTGKTFNLNPRGYKQEDRGMQRIYAQL
ncbi:hypothetical protein [Psychromonas aquimarina]|uniref:hypothetical protein n=1 Tax=Psychromonas aquimarina TaxID=444919 RepID=UPI001B7FB96E|nr:hypothetical protein [Psychromonas aquimarina]